MSDLEPITRNEMLWSGEDLEPKTRREMYIRHLYDETQVIPEYPKTREEYFINKAGEELHDVTIEQLNVSENGTYSESGKAYSPVIVDVPLPENAYLLKDIPNTPTPIATFTDGSDLPMPKLEVAIEPVQEGSGDPSPENIRPIIGWDEAVVTVADDAESPTTSHEYTIDLNGTIYGGKLDVVSGVLTVDRVEFDLGNATWTYRSDIQIFQTLTDFDYSKDAQKANISSCYEYNGVVSSGSASKVDKKFSLYSGSGNNLWICDLDYSDATIFKNSLSGQKAVIYLAIPQTIQLTPTIIKSLQGENNFFASTGEVIKLQYWSKEVS